MELSSKFWSLNSFKYTGRCDIIVRGKKKLISVPWKAHEDVRTLMAKEEYHERRLRGGCIISSYASASCDYTLSSWDISTKRPL